MTYVIHDFSERGLFIVKLYGRHSLNDQFNLMKDLTTHPNWKNGMNLLGDWSQMVVSDFNMDRVHYACHHITIYKHLFDQCRHGIICPDYGHIKAAYYGLLTEETIGWTVRIFHIDDYDGALEWLEGNNKPLRECNDFGKKTRYSNSLFYENRSKNDRPVKIGING